VWWGALQAVLTFYIANRVAQRDWNHPRFSKKGWALTLLLNGAVVVLFQLSGYVPKGTVAGMVSMVIVLIATLIIFWRILPKDERVYVEFERSRLMDYLSVITVAVFVVSMFLVFDPTRLVASNVNLTAVRIVTVWTAILAVIMLAYRLYSKKEIPV